MADRKAKTITVKFPCTATVNDVKNALAKEGEANPTCVEDLGAGEFLIEFVTKEKAEDYLDNGVDFHEIHFQCNPPHGYHVNVSILGLKAYVDDEKVIEALSEYGEIKSELIRLKYCADHDLAGIENGNPLVHMVLSKVSIPYSLRIDGQWCRIIHNNQQRVCSFCHGVGHSRRKCPEIECHHCGSKGHIARDCEQPAPDISHNDDLVTQDNEETPEENTPAQAAETPTASTQPLEHIEEDPLPEKPQPDVTMDGKGKENVATYDFLRPCAKRHTQTTAT